MKNYLTPKVFRLTAIAATCAAVSAPLPLVAQSALEEIVITGRKREESLQEVPISISVLGESLISDAGLVTQQDLFELVPGIHYDQTFDRNAALPSVRGVQSNETATNRTKVTAFIDGMPIIGSQGSLSLANVQQVEVYRGPQSAAFGRSTFGGAINYITRDPGDEFEANLSLDINDFGRKIINGMVSGPINDSVGYMIEASVEDSDSPDEYTASDGTQYGTRGTDYISAKLVFNPTDATEIELAFSRVETNDGPTGEYFITEEAFNECYDGTVINAMGMNAYATGTVNCDWSQGFPILAQNDREALLIENGVTDENILFLARSQSLPESEVGTFDERDRFAVQIDHGFDDGSALQFSGFTGKEYYIRGNDGSNTATVPIDISDNGDGTYSVNTGMGATVGSIMSDPTDIDELYAEVRWVSPAEERLRYLIGASYYDYSFLTNLYFGGYGAILEGQDAIDRYDTLVGNPDGVSVGNPTVVFSEDTTNVGAFFNVSYDVSDKLTVTAEGRYQSDEVSGYDATYDISASVTTKSFMPRLSFNYNLDDNNSFYGQIAKGNNPAGVNVSLYNENYIDAINDGVVNDDSATNGEPALYTVSYTAESLQVFEEEQLLNLELGMKGTAFDGLMQYSAAIFKMYWDDQVQNENLDWSNPAIDTDDGDFTGTRLIINNGDLEMQGLEFEGNFNFTDNFSLRGTLTYLDATYTDYCSLGWSGTGLEFDTSRITTSNIYDNAECYDVSGFEVAEQPKLSGSISPSFVTDLSGGLSLNIRGDIRYEGEQWYDEANVAKADAVTTMNLSAGVSSDSWNVALYINNLTDEDYPSQWDADTNYSVAGEPSMYLIRPRTSRTVGLRASYRF